MKPLTKKIAACSILFLLLGCDKSDSDGGLAGLDDFFIPDFSNAWTVAKGNTTGLFFINSAEVDSTKGTGLLTAQDEDGVHNYEVRGSFKNLDVKMNYLTNEENNGDNGPNAGASYSGKYDTLSKPYHIRMVNTNLASDSLVLTHG